MYIKDIFSFWIYFGIHNTIYEKKNCVKNLSSNYEKKWHT